MPIYEYACEKCGNEFEVEQRITEDPVKTCPSCRSRKVKRLISQTSFVLKGGGWYSDLYSSKGGKKKDADSGGGSKDAGSDGGSKDAGQSGDGSKSGSGGDKDAGKGKGKSKGKKAAA